MIVLVAVMGGVGAVVQDARINKETRRFDTRFKFSPRSREGREDLLDFAKVNSSSRSPFLRG